MIPAWLAHERSGSGLVGPGAGWDPTWAAEMADGEAHIGFSGEAGRICVHQASDDGPPEMLTRLQAMFSGTVRKCKNRPEHGERRQLYDWRLCNRAGIEAALRAVWPWLGEVKRRQAMATLAGYAVTHERSTEARRRWANPKWRAAHPDAVANGPRLAALSVTPNRDPATGRWRPGVVA